MSEAWKLPTHLISSPTSSSLRFLPSSPLNTHYLSDLRLGMAEECGKEKGTLIQGDRNVKMGKGHMCHLLSWMLILQHQSYSLGWLVRELGFSFFFIYSTGSALSNHLQALLKSPLELYLVEKNKPTLKFLISPNSTPGKPAVSTPSAPRSLLVLSVKCH